MAFVSLAPLGTGKLLRGDAAWCPLSPGQVVVVKGVFANGSAAGEALGVVTRLGWTANAYYIKYLDAQNEFLHWHLFDNDKVASPTYSRILTTKDEMDEDVSGDPTEWISAWYVLGEPGEEVELGKVPWIKDVRKVRNDITFVGQMMTTEKEPPQVTLLVNSNRLRLRHHVRSAHAWGSSRNKTITNGSRPAFVQENLNLDVLVVPEWAVVSSVSCVV
jgi:hypothetical protein